MFGVAVRGRVGQVQVVVVDHHLVPDAARVGGHLSVRAGAR